MNRIVSITLCLPVVCTSIFSSDTSSTTSASSTATHVLASLIVPPVKSWVKRAREQQEQQRKEPEVVTLLKTYTGQEKDTERFHDIPHNRRLLDAHVEQLIINLNHGTAQQTEEFLQLCADRNVEINYDASAELFKAAYESRVEREKNYTQSIEDLKQLISGYRTKQIKELTDTLERAKKQAEIWVNTLATLCTQHAQAYGRHTKKYTNIMLLARKLNPQFAPAYATNPALYYDDLEKEFGLKIKMEEQAALATHMRELSKLLIAMKQFGNIDIEQAAQDQWLDEWVQDMEKNPVVIIPNKRKTKVTVPSDVIAKAQKLAEQRKEQEQFFQRWMHEAAQDNVNTIQKASFYNFSIREVRKIMQKQLPSTPDTQTNATGMDGYLRRLQELKKNQTSHAAAATAPNQESPSSTTSSAEPDKQ